jgi:putative ABC transport system substrate-binding protein
MRRVSRRQFVVGAGGFGVALGSLWLPGCALPLAQPPPAPKVYRVGYLIPGPSELTAAPAAGTASGPGLDTLRQVLNDYGYVEGQNLAIEYRATARGMERLRELTVELERLPVDVIVASAGAALPARQATETTPIVFVGGGDPVANGLVASLARPGGNVTGMALEVVGALQGKRLELLKEAVPGLSRVAVLEDANLDRAGRAFSAGATAAEALGLQLQPMNVRRPDDLAGAFEMVARARADGLLWISTPLLVPSQAQIADLALKYRLPSISTARPSVEAGGLMSY